MTCFRVALNVADQASGSVSGSHMGGAAGYDQHVTPARSGSACRFVAQVEAAAHFSCGLDPWMLAYLGLPGFVKVRAEGGGDVSMDLYRFAANAVGVEPAQQITLDGLDHRIELGGIGQFELQSAAQGVRVVVVRVVLTFEIHRCKAFAEGLSDFLVNGCGLCALVEGLASKLGLAPTEGANAEDDEEHASR